MEQKRIKVRLTKNSPYSNYGYYEEGDIGYIDGYVNDNAVIILENGKFAKADLRWIEVVNEKDKNVNTELAESEDEKIRKSLSAYFAKFKPNDMWDEDFSFGNIVAWLEKQCEQKLPIEKLPSEMRSIGESLGFTTQEECDRYNQMVSDLIMSDDDKGEQKPADEVGNYDHGKVLDSLMSAEIKTPEESLGIDSKTYSEIIDECIYGEQKPAWSEEDEKLVKNLISTLSNLYARNLIEKETKEKYTNFLKSLKDRYTWKPSDEQMDVLLSKVTAWTKGCPKQIVLESLYQDLQKLREK